MERSDTIHCNTWACGSIMGIRRDGEGVKGRAGNKGGKKQGVRRPGIRDEDLACVENISLPKKGGGFRGKTTGLSPVLRLLAYRKRRNSGEGKGMRGGRTDKVW